MWFVIDDGKVTTEFDYYSATDKEPPKFLNISAGREETKQYSPVIVHGEMEGTHTVR